MRREKEEGGEKGGRVKGEERKGMNAGGKIEEVRRGI